MGVIVLYSARKFEKIKRLGVPTGVTIMLKSICYPELITNLTQCVGVLPVHGQLNQFLAQQGPLVPSSFICSDCITLTRI